MSDRQRHVLLTGAGGFIGSHILQSLATTPWKITVIDSFQHSGVTDRIVSALSEVGMTPGERELNVITHDLTAPVSQGHFLRLGPVDVILDVASRPSVDQSISSPREFILNNVAVTLSTLELARSLRPSRYVHISTDEVYGPNGAPCDYTHHEPSSPYAASKAAQDDICYAYPQTYKLPITIACASNMFGERQSQLAFIPRIISLALAGQFVKVHVTDGQPGSRHYNYAGDVGDWLVELIADTEPDEWVERLGFPGRYTIDNVQLATRVWKIVHKLTGECGADPLLEFVEATTVRPSYDSSYAPVTENDRSWLHKGNLDNAPLDDRLRRTVEWFVNNREWLTL